MLLTGDLINSRMTEALRDIINWDVDLPKYIFSSRNFQFFFFARPIIGDEDLLVSILSSNAKNYDAKPFSSFGKPLSEDYAQLFFDDNDALQNALVLKDGFRDFFCGRVNYPLLISNTNIDWVVFETAYEELGVLAIKNTSMNCKKFIDDLVIESLFSCAQFDRASADFIGLQNEYGDLLALLRGNYCLCQADNTK
jgi:hypothetical protein